MKFKSYDGILMTDQNKRRCGVPDGWMGCSKGQLISKCPFGVFKSPKKTKKYFFKERHKKDISRLIDLYLASATLKKPS